ncbi:MAG: peroxiredoxin [Planctomycetota bacterium]
MDNLIRPVTVGGLVPDFTLKTYDPARQGFGTFELAKQKAAGRWTILFFYPADFTFVCATEFAALAEKDAEMRKLGADVVTVSNDTEFVHLAWQRSEEELAGVRFPMGADPRGVLGRLFGVLDENSGLTLRGTFLISPDGKLMNSEVNFYNLGRNVDELLRKLKGNLYLAANGSEACPAKWSAHGDATLKPGPELVGKVRQALANQGA